MINLLFAMVLTSMLSTSLADITRAISSGDADALGQHFDQTVEIAILDQDNIYNKAQAIGVIRQFFSQNTPRSFSQVHQGTSKGADSQYCIGNLNTASGTFRVYIYMKSVGGKHLIQELRFDKE